MEQAKRDSIEVICRTARESDTADMLELTREIWDGQDYVPRAWAGWLADPHGRLIVAEFNHRVIGLNKLSRQDPGAWWLQGLRVHPEFGGRGVASQLHRAGVQTWERIGDGTLRLGTSSIRFPVHHLCEKDGFIRVGEYTDFFAPEPNPTTADIDPSRLPFEPIRAAEAEQALESILNSPTWDLQNGLFELGWEYQPPNLRLIRQAADRRTAWWWRGRGGMLLAYDEEDEDDPLGRQRGYLTWLSCPLDQLEALLTDYRRLVRQRGASGAAWVAPVKPAALAALEAAGFSRQWENTLYIYAKVHPSAYPIKAL